MLEQGCSNQTAKNKQLSSSATTESEHYSIIQTYQYDVQGRGQIFKYKILEQALGSEASRRINKTNNLQRAWTVSTVELGVGSWDLHTSLILKRWQMKSTLATHRGEWIRQIRQIDRIHLISAPKIIIQFTSCNSKIRVQKEVLSLDQLLVADCSGRATERVHPLTNNLKKYLKERPTPGSRWPISSTSHAHNRPTRTFYTNDDINTHLQEQYPILSEACLASDACNGRPIIWCTGEACREIGVWFCKGSVGRLCWLCVGYLLC